MSPADRATLEALRQIGTAAFGRYTLDASLANLDALHDANDALRSFRETIEPGAPHLGVWGLIGWAEERLSQQS